MEKKYCKNCFKATLGKDKLQKQCKECREQLERDFIAKEYRDNKILGFNKK